MGYWFFLELFLADEDALFAFWIILAFWSETVEQQEYNHEERSIERAMLNVCEESHAIIAILLLVMLIHYDYNMEMLIK